MNAACPWRPVDDGLLVAVRLTPKGGRDSIDGIERRPDGTAALKARVRPPAHEGAANAALQALIARALDVPASRVRLVAGAGARNKTLMIAGDSGALVRKLDRLTARPVTEPQR